MSVFRNLLMAHAAKPYRRQLEYLESSGTQYIDTGIIGDSTITTHLRAAYTVKESPQVLIGQYKNLTQIYTITTMGANIVCQFGQDGISGDYNGYAAFEVMDFQLGTGGWFINGVKKSDKADISFSAPNTLYLFARNQNGAPARFAKARIYACKLYSGETLVRDFIPVLDKNNMPCMYDKVSGGFFYNLGDGQFTYGE